MKRQRFLLRLATTLALAFVSTTASADMVMKMGLEDLVGNADKVFRGTVLTKEPGTVSAGGSEFSTVIYSVRVDQALKGDFGSGTGAAVVTLTMLASLKADASAGTVMPLFTVDVNPNMQVGSDYVLFTTTPSAIGLSTTVGLGQGLFRIFTDADGLVMTANSLNNDQIFDGPVQFGDLTAAIEVLVNQ